MLAWNVFTTRPSPWITTILPIYYWTFLIHPGWMQAMHGIPHVPLPSKDFKQQLYSDFWAPRTISEAKPSHPAQENNFSPLSCIWGLILSVTTQSSWAQVMTGVLINQEIESFAFRLREHFLFLIFHRWRNISFTSLKLVDPGDQEEKTPLFSKLFTVKCWPGDTSEAVLSAVARCLYVCVWTDFCQSDISRDATCRNFTGVFR